MTELQLQVQPHVEYTIGLRLAQARQAIGYSPEQLAMRIGAKPSTISKWESGPASPRANRLAQLAGVLNVSLMWLLAGDENTPESARPDFEKADHMEKQLSRAEELLLELSTVMVEIRRETRRLQGSPNEEAT
jgi:transcriptional regulator with XRE-family HTH domain